MYDAMYTYPRMGSADIAAAENGASLESAAMNSDVFPVVMSYTLYDGTVAGVVYVALYV